VKTHKNETKVIELWIVGVSAIALLPLFLASFKFFPFNNGWWPAFNYLEMNGLEMYRDFNTVYPPAFTKFLSILHNVSFSPAFSLAWGIGRCYFLFGILVYFFSRFSSIGVAGVGAFLVVFTQAKSTVFIPDDYHVFQRTIFVALLLALWFFLQPSGKARQNVIAFGLGVVGSYLLFSKQNIGLIVSFGLLLSMLRGSILGHNTWWAPVTLFFGFVGGVTLWLFAFSVDLNSLYAISFGNDSKGGLLTISTNIIAYPHNSRLILAGMVLAPISLAVIYWWKDIASSSLAHKLKVIPSVLISLIIAVSISLGMVVLLKLYSHVVNLTAVWCIVVASILSFTSRYKIFSMVYPLGGLVYANSMTSGLVDETLILIAAPLFVILLGILEKHLDKNNQKLLRVGILTVVLALSVQAWTKKFNEPYSWWGYSVAPISESTYTPPYELLSGVTVDYETLEMLKTIKSRVEEYSKGDSDVYFYPHLAFFYILHEKFPPTSNPIQWFDVISNSQMQNEIDYLKHSGPELLVMFDASYYAYQGHLRMKKNLPQLRFIEGVNELIADGKYRVLDYKIYRRGIEGILNKGVLNDVKITIANPRFEGEKLLDVLGQLLNGSPRSFILDLAIFDGVGIKLEDSDVINHIIKANDILMVSAKPEIIETLAKNLGFIDKSVEAWYSLKILVRQ
jgi:hypothetical protein